MTVDGCYERAVSLAGYRLVSSGKERCADGPRSMRVSQKDGLEERVFAGAAPWEEGSSPQPRAWLLTQGGAGP
jgi:hypothetical protein